MSVVDLFCGVGGLSLGFKRAGFKIAAGVDLDPSCGYAFERYSGGRFLNADVSRLKSTTLAGFFDVNEPRILIGCAPCQTFSEYNKKSRGNNWNLLPSFARMAEECDPDIVSMENVARLATYKGGRPFRAFVNRLAAAGFNVTWFIVSCGDYGISQRRKRLVLFGSRRGFIEMIPPTHQTPPTLREVIRTQPVLRAGATHGKDRFHRAQALSARNAERLRASRPGGSWKDWPEHLRADCHKTKKGAEFGSVYGRLTWGEIGPTVTTQFYKYGTGRFGHPTQGRALSLREGALLQTFPPKFEFIEPGVPIAMDKVGRLIGNAVPVRLAEVIGRAVSAHIDERF